MLSAADATAALVDMAVRHLTRWKSAPATAQAAVVMPALRRAPRLRLPHGELNRPLLRRT